jgi:hypothetical protein
MSPERPWGARDQPVAAAPGLAGGDGVIRAHFGPAGPRGGRQALPRGNRGLSPLRKLCHIGDTVATMGAAKPRRQKPWGPKNYQKGFPRGCQESKLKAARKTLAAAWSPDLIAKVTELPSETIK